MATICDISGKRSFSAKKVSHANNKSNRRMHPNIQLKKLYISEYGIWITPYVATSTLRTINKYGLWPVLKKAYKKDTLSARLKPLVRELKKMPFPPLKHILEHHGEEIQGQ